MNKQILAKELKIGDKVAIQGGGFEEISFVELSPNGKSVFYKFKGDDYKMRKGANTKIPLY
jgi:hypothetical protein